MPPRREGRVIRILERANDTLVGTLQKSRNFCFVVADDPRFVHNLYVPAPAPPLTARVGDKVVAQLDAWPSRHVNPEGHIIEVLGPTGSPGVDMLSISGNTGCPARFLRRCFARRKPYRRKSTPGNWKGVRICEAVSS